MNLPNDIRLKIEKSPDKEDILLLLARLENDGVTITNDVYAAIVATLEYTKLGPLNRSSPHILAGKLGALKETRRMRSVDAGQILVILPGRRVSGRGSCSSWRRFAISGRRRRLRQ